MATTNTQLTPKADQSPAVIDLSKELSGAIWVGRFLGSRDVSALTPEFAAMVARFIGAMRSAGADVEISSTYRPAERAYLMHWSWRIAKAGFSPQSVPPMAGVNIEWNHSSAAQSTQAAQAMVNGYQTVNLKFPPALADTSLHPLRKAIDMTIHWVGDLRIADADGKTVSISTSPRDGMNEELKEVGKSYGVIKWLGGASDKPHWSADGH